jgi:hypothetical protein
MEPVERSENLSVQIYVVTDYLLFGKLSLRKSATLCFASAVFKRHRQPSRESEGIRARAKRG